MLATVCCNYSMLSYNESAMLVCVAVERQSARESVRELLSELVRRLVVVLAYSHLCLWYCNKDVEWSLAFKVALVCIV